MSDKGFDVIDTGYKDTDPLGDWGAKAHQALDRIIAGMKDESGDCGGGSAQIIGTCALDHVHKFRLLFMEFTGEKECCWCNGTGVEGS